VRNLRLEIPEVSGHAVAQSRIRGIDYDKTNTTQFAPPWNFILFFADYLFTCYNTNKYETYFSCNSFLFAILFFLVEVVATHKSIRVTTDQFFNGDALPDAPELAARGEFHVGVRTLDLSIKGRLIS